MKTRFKLLLCLFLLFGQADAAIYEAAEYFVAPQMWDNSQRLQALVDKVHSEGGGTIQLAAGEYIFRSSIHWQSAAAAYNGNRRASLSMRHSGGWTAPRQGKPGGRIHDRRHLPDGSVVEQRR